MKDPFCASPCTRQREAGQVSPIALIADFRGVLIDDSFVEIYEY